MVRTVMNASTIEEVIRILKKCKVASAFSLNVLDTKTFKAINIEKDIEEIYVTNIEDRYARANHFTTKKDELPNSRLLSKYL